MAKFKGREKELRSLKLLLAKTSSSLAVIRGRRRIGKSRLIDEFRSPLPSHIITGLPPTKDVTKQMQLDEFCGQMAESFGLPPFQVRDWSEAFGHLTRHCAHGRLVIALDEISWMGSKDPRFLAHLKHAWDRGFSKNPELILILCGSVSSWIEANILSSTGFVGRVSLDLHLKELPLHDAAEFWDGLVDRTSPQEILKVLSVTGGVPRYLEEILPTQSAEENIRRLCFDPAGILYREFDQIFSDLFSARAPVYATILEFLAQGARTSVEVAEHLGDKRQATVVSYLKELAQASFVAQDATWNLKALKTSKLSRYRLSDNYIRFYLKYIRPRKESIAQGSFEEVPLSSLPGWDTIIGLQFENLVLNNVPAILRSLNLNPADVVRYGPFFQRRTERAKGCQIDLLIQTKFRILYLCEIKFSAVPIGVQVGEKMQEQLRRISMPRGYSAQLVLIHVNGISRDLQQSGLIDHAIDFGALLQ